MCLGRVTGEHPACCGSEWVEGSCGDTFLEVLCKNQVPQPCGDADLLLAGVGRVSEEGRAGGPQKDIYKQRGSTAPLGRMDGWGSLHPGKRLAHTWVSTEHQGKDTRNTLLAAVFVIRLP